MPRSTPDSAWLLPDSGTRLSLSLAGLPMPFPFFSQPFWQSIPRHINMTVWAPPISLAATLGIISLFSFRPVTKMFQFTGFPSLELLIHSRILEDKLKRVSPFGIPRIKGL